MRRLNSILTPPATAGRGVRVASLLGGLAVLGLSVAGSVALAAQREPSAPFALQDDGSAATQSAARAAAAAAFASLPPEQQERFRNPTAAEYREICSTGEPSDEAFCAGVLFANLPYKAVTPVDFCPPVLPDGEFDIDAVATKGRQNMVAVPVQSGETINGVAKAALRTAFPCQVTAEPMKTVAPVADATMLLNGQPMAVGLPYWGLAVDRIDVQTGEAGGQTSMNFVVQTTVTPPVFANDVRLPDGIGLNAVRSDMIESRETAEDGSIRVRIKPRPRPTLARSAASVQVSGPSPMPGTTRLTIGLDYGNRPLVLTREDRLRISLRGIDEDGNRFEQASVFELAPGIDLPDVTWLDLGDAYFPTSVPGRAYTLTAQIENGEGGHVLYAAEPTTIRLAPQSKGRLGNLRPEMLLRPVDTP